MKKCEKCGFVTENNEMDFCVKCGSKMTDISDVKAKNAPVRYCGKCGAENEAEAVFCINCGSPINEPHTENANTAPAKKSYTKIVVFSAAAVVLISGIIFGGIYLKNKDTAVAVSENSAVTVPETNKKSTKRELIPDPDEGKLFRQGLLPVSDEEGNWGYIDNTGKFVIEPQFSAARNFSRNGLAPVCNEYGVWGYIDTSGEYVIRSQYSNAYSFNGDGLAVVSFADETILYNNSSSSYNDFLYGYIDETGEAVIEPKFSSASDFNESALAVVSEKTDSGTMYGYIDYSGEYVIPPQYHDAKNFSKNGLAAVSVIADTVDVNEEYSYDSYKYGYINTNGEFVIEPKYETAEPFNSDGTAVVSMVDYDYQFDDSFGSVYGSIDENGNTVIDMKYRFLSNFDSYGYAIYQTVEFNDGYNYGIMDRKENILMRFQRFDGATVFNQGLACVLCPNGGYINEYGETVIPMEMYTDVQSATCFFNDGFAIVSNSTSTNIIDINGNIVKKDIDFIIKEWNYNELSNYFFMVYPKLDDLYRYKVVCQ